jgi:hypothetical protein
MFSFVQRRNEKVILAAARSTAIVSSMFPSNVRDRLYKEQEEQEKHRHRGGNLKNFLRDDGNNMSDDIADAQFSSKPLADLFPETTVLVSSKKVNEIAMEEKQCSNQHRFTSTILTHCTSVFAISLPM